MYSKLRNLYERELSTDFPSKPNSLPLSSPQQVTDFENIPNEEYRKIVISKTCIFEQQPMHDLSPNYSNVIDFFFSDKLLGFPGWPYLDRNGQRNSEERHEGLCITSFDVARSEEGRDRSWKIEIRESALWYVKLVFFFSISSFL